MIPAAHVFAWQESAPWSDIAQVEQDLVLCRALVILFSDLEVRERLAFRGGTALHKLHLAPSARYSEDIDLVQVAAGPAKPVFEAVRRCLDPWLGKPKTKTKSNGVQLIYSFETDVPPTRRMRMKVEVNTREHFSELGFRILPFAVESRWFAGEASILSYSLNELLGTKLRALFQRKKGRDLFDLWRASGSGGFDAEMVIRCFRAYLAHGGLAISQSEFLANLEEKQRDPMFLADVPLLLAPTIQFDPDAGMRLVRERLIALL